MSLKIDDYKDFEMFYKLPQELFDECFNGLSIGAKVLYAILRDKWGQSQKNGWHDEKGIYCNFSVKLLSETMSCSEKTITSYKKELNNYHLISEKRQFNSTNKIYVNRVSEAKKYVHEDFTCTERKKLPHVHEDFTCTERKKLLTNQTNINHTNLTINNDDDKEFGNFENNQSGTIADTLRSRGFKLDQVQYQQLFEYVSLDNMSIPLIQHAISKSADNGVRNFKYLKSILDNWKKKGITTVEEAEKEDEDFKSKKESSKNSTPKSRRVGNSIIQMYEGELPF
nr:MAG TPA: replisome organizer protein [Caudoviricetes sp.]